MVDRFANVADIPDFVIRFCFPAGKDAPTNRLMQLDLNRGRPNLVLCPAVGIEQDAAVAVLVDRELPFQF